MKLAVKRFLQRALSFHRYLVLHSVFVALTLRVRRGEGAILRFIDRLPDDANVLDIGANVGTMTLLFAKHCRRGHVFAFEPIPENLAALRTIVRLFGLHNVTIFPFGLGERDEIVRMIMPSQDGVRLEGLSHVVAAGSEDGTFYEVALRRLDSMAEFQGLRIHAMKLDVENHEQYVLAGATRIIERERPLVYAELWGDQNRSSCFELMADHGYRAFGSETGRAIAPLESMSTGPENVFFFPRMAVAP